MSVRSLIQRTFRFYDPNYEAMHKLESIIYNLEDTNGTVNYDSIWSLSQQIQFSTIGAIRKRFNRLDQFVCKHILKEKGIFFNPKARKLMHALGFQSITMHEYNALNLNDDEQIHKMNISQSGTQKLKLLLLASRGQENHLTVDLSGYSDVNEISSTHNIVGALLCIWSNFPWLAALASTFQTQTVLLYFGALYDFLWNRYHHEFGFPPFDSMLVNEMEFVKYMMDRHRLRIHEKFSESKKKTFRWMEEHAQQQDYSETNLGATSMWMKKIRFMWMNVREAQRSLFWALKEAVRLNELLMPGDEVLANQFMTEYVLAITEGGILRITWSEERPFLTRIIKKLIRFNVQETETTLRLREILRAVC